MNKQEQIQILTHTEKGYQPLIAFDAWRVACLNHSEKTTVEGLPYFQKHDQTDEVFILLNGACTLVLAGAAAKPEEICCIPMRPHSFYNIQKGVWHTHVLTEDAMVCVVENDNTSLDNSPVSPITSAQRSEIQRLLAYAAVLNVRPGVFTPVPGK